MDSEKAKNLAERIASLLQDTEKPQNDFTALQATLEKINERLDKIETQIISQNSDSKFQTPNFNPFHPSQDKFAVNEAVVNELIDHLKVEKACTFEPNGKPCDHCSMCNSRGF